MRKSIKKDSLEGKIEKIKEDFYKTGMFKRWKLRGVENEIMIITDNLEKWRDLKVSIISDGITLYSKYRGFIKGRQQVIIYWDKIKSESKRVLLSKKLYGYTYKKSKYKGLVELTNSTKLGTNCILAELADSKKIIYTFRNLGITVKTILVSRL